jgi:imidazolonepropionase-like amidohydrolase
MKKTLLSLGLIVFGTLVVMSQRTLIHAGSIIDGVSDKVAKEQTIIIESDRITGVKNGFENPEDGDIVIDLKAMTVMPGFIDMHIHIEGQSSPTRYIDGFTKNPADVAFQSTVYAKTTLMAGFTTVRDMGGSGVNVSLRNAINKGTVDGPRIFTAEKALSITGGHGDPTNGYRADLMGDPGPKEGVVNSVEDGKKAVRQRYKNGADWIKITATGGVLSMAKDGMGPHFKEDEIASIVSAAKDLGFSVAAHAHGDEGMARAIRAGVTTIEHGTYMSEATMDLMIAKGCYLIPTISAGMSAAINAEKPGYFPEIIAKKARVIGPLILDTFSKAYKKGVPIGFGTDAAVFPHGDNAKEFEYMVQGGMPAMEAIQTATSVNAKILKETENIGTIAEGRFADIVAVKGDPIIDITLLQSIDFVMKGGKVYKSADK